MKIALVAILIIVVIGVVLVGRNIYFVESAFNKTPAGKIEIKTIPESKVLISALRGNYYNTKNILFRNLFNYIQDNQVSMTVPVEAEIDNSKMKFYLGNKDKVKDLPDRANVRVETVPGRTVLSIGIRGAYNKSNFDKALAKLESWFNGNTKHVRGGEAYVVFWDAPFMPWFLKRSEVHIPVTTKQK
jgi:effector-binding domain-containing protein